MTIYNYNEFVHPVPAGYVIPKGTPAQRVESSPHPLETFFIAQFDMLVHPSDEVTFYLTYDITAPRLPEAINSVIYNVSYLREVFPVAVYQGNQLWSAFSKKGKRSTIYSSEIEFFDTTPSKEGNHD